MDGWMMDGWMDGWLAGWMDMRACELEYDMIDEHPVCSCDPFAFGDGCMLSWLGHRNLLGTDGTYIRTVYPHATVCEYILKQKLLCMRLRKRQRREQVLVHTGRVRVVGECVEGVAGLLAFH